MTGSERAFARRVEDEGYRLRFELTPWSARTVMRRWTQGDAAEKRLVEAVLADCHYHILSDALRRGSLVDAWAWIDRCLPIPRKKDN